MRTELKLAQVCLLLVASVALPEEGLAQRSTWSNKYPLPGETRSLQLLGNLTLITVHRPTNFVGLISWQESWNLRNWITLHADSVDLTGIKGIWLDEMKDVSPTAVNNPMLFWRVLYDARTPVQDTTWDITRTYLNPDHLTNATVKVLFFGDDAPRMLEVRFTMTAKLIPTGNFPIMDPPYANGTTTIGIAGGKEVSYTRFDSLEYARSDQLIRVDFDGRSQSNRTIQVQFSFAAANAPTNGWPGYADHEHYP